MPKTVVLPWSALQSDVSLHDVKPIQINSKTQKVMMALSAGLLAPNFNNNPNPGGGFLGFGTAHDWNLFHWIGDNAKSFVDGSIEKWYQFVGDVYSWMMKLVLHTPDVLISNPEVSRLWWIFVGVSTSLISFMTVVEGIKITLGKSRMDFGQILGKTCMSFLGLGFTLPTMTYAISFFNKFVEHFVNIAHKGMDPGLFFTENIMGVFMDGGFNFIISILFMVMFLYFMFKIILQTGRRWFDIIVAAIISPLAFSSAIFDSTSTYFKKWWDNVVHLYLMQVVYAIYMSIIAIIILSPMGSNSDSFTGLVRVILLIGALWRMSEPPNFVIREGGNLGGRKFANEARKRTNVLKNTALGKAKGVIDKWKK